MCVTPLPGPKHWRLAAACTERTGTTNRKPSADASSVLHNAAVSGRAACASTRRALALVIVSDCRSSCVIHASRQGCNLWAHQWFEPDVARFGQQGRAHANP